MKDSPNTSSVPNNVASVVSKGASEGSAVPKSTWKQRLSVAGVVAGVWATLPRFMGPKLAGLETSKEIVDHLIPGLLVVAVSVAVFFLGRRHFRAWGTTMFAAGLIVVLGGLWMTATHIPLLAQAQRHEVGWGAAWFHSTPGLVVLSLGLLWTCAFWADAATAADVQSSDGTV